MLFFYFLYNIIMRTVPEHLDSDVLYWTLSSFLMLSISIYIFSKSKKTVPSLFVAVACIVLFSYDIVDYLYIAMTDNTIPDYFKVILFMSISVVTYVLIARKRYDWRKLKSKKYNPNKVQAIYSKPNDFITLLGSATSLSPKCSVRYCYNGRMIRFKRGYPTPIMTKTIIKKTDIIENTDIDPESFYPRFDDIKNKKYNLLRFNCRHLFNRETA